MRSGSQSLCCACSYLDLLQLMSPILLNQMFMLFLCHQCRKCDLQLRIKLNQAGSPGVEPHRSAREHCVSGADLVSQRIQGLTLVYGCLEAPHCLGLRALHQPLPAEENQRVA